jgi:hypothetical protein
MTCHRMQGLVREARPRQRSWDALDAGFRLSVALYLDVLWVFWAFSPRVNYYDLWLGCLILVTLPAVGVNVYGVLTFVAVLRERSWRSAGRSDLPPSHRC